MPRVEVVVNRSKPETRSADGGFNKELADLLRHEVAAALSCADTGGHITEDDIEVHIRDREVLCDFGGDRYDIQITVWAGDYPTRRANLDERCGRIKKAIADTYGQRNLRGYIWVNLVKFGFEEF